MALREYLDLLRRRWWLLLLGPVAAGLGAYLVSRALTPIYEASATILVNQTQVPGVVQYNDVLTSERLTNTYAELVERRPILTDVIARLDLPLSEGALAAKLSVTSVRNTQLLRVTAEDADPALAALIADTVALAFIEDNAAQLGRPGTVSIAEEASVPGAPARPHVALNTALAAILGLLVAGSIGLVLEYLDDTVKTSEDVEKIAGLSTLGVVSRFKSGAPSRAAIQMTARSPSAEAYRQLRTNVHFAKLAAELKTILITSPNPREGKSTTTANLAVALAQAGERVIVIDTDLRRPTQHLLFQVPNSFGLTGLLLNGRVEAERALLPTDIENLRVLPSGPLPPNPSELLTSPLVAPLIASLRRAADYVLFDSPPLLAVTDGSILASQTDGTILVVEMSRTRSEFLRRAHEALAKAQARPLGVVLNKARSSRRGYYYYGYYGQGTERQETLEGAVGQPTLPSP